MKDLRIALALAVACALAAGAGFVAWQHYAGGSAQAGADAPALVLTDLAGKPHALSEWRGRLLLLNFWATWCAPCMGELPLLVEAQQRYGARGLQVVGPAMDEPDAVRETAKHLGIGYPLMADFSQVDAAMAALGDTQGALPFSVLISADGKIIKTILGGLHKNELEGLIEPNLPR